jgi:CMP/dCMP kinase
MREMALERGISLIELGREAETDGGVIDQTLDERQKNLGIHEDNFIIDGRLAFHFIPHAVKIFLQVDSHESARRIFHDETRK